MNSADKTLEEWNKKYPDIKPVEFYPLERKEVIIFVLLITSIIFLIIGYFSFNGFMDAVNSRFMMAMFFIVMTAIA